MNPTGAEQTLESNPQADLFTVLAAGYAANRDSFQFGECRIRVRQGQCKTVEDAIAGQFSTALEHEIHWVFDGDSVLCTDEPRDPEEYQAIIDTAFKEGVQPAATGSQSAKLGVTLPFGRFALLSSDGDLGLRYSPLLGSGKASLFAGDRPPPMVEVDPFTIGMMAKGAKLNPAYFLDGVAQGKYTGRIHESKDVDDEFVVSVDTESKKPFVKYWFDSTRGFETSRIDMYTKDGEASTRAYTTELKDFGDRWLPTRRVKIQMPDRQGPYRVTEYVVTAADFENHPDRAVFQINLPAGTKVGVRGGELSLVTLQNKKTVGLDSLSSFISEIDHKQQIASQPPPVGGDKESLSRPSWRNSILSVNVIVILCIFVFVALKRMRSRKGEGRA